MCRAYLFLGGLHGLSDVSLNFRSGKQILPSSVAEVTECDAVDSA